MSCAVRTKMDYVQELGVDVTADLLLAYETAIRDHYLDAGPERIRAGLDAMTRVLEAHKAQYAVRPART